MKKIIIAAMDRNGVIGRTSKACPGGRMNSQGRIFQCERGVIWTLDPTGRGGERFDCRTCRGTGRVPANDVPWSYPEIDEHFDRVTMGYAVIMGRRTWEARGGLPLKGRATVVVSRHMFDEPGVYVARTIDGAIRMVRAYEETDETAVHIGGGAKLYSAALPLADELDLVLIDRAFDGDVRFPDDWLPRPELGAGSVVAEDGSRFECIERRQGSTPELTFTRWVRR